MQSQTLSHAATELIASYGNTARNVITAYRAGSERVAGFLDQRWESALKRSSDQLAVGVREDAQALHDLLNGYYSKSIALTSAGATALVDKAVELAGQGVSQVAANAGLFEEKTGMATLRQIALAATPAIVAVHSVASRIEKTSGQFADKVAGKTTQRASAFKKARARKAG